MGVGRNLHNHLVAGFADVRMVSLQNKDRHSVAGEEAVAARKGHRMGVAAEGNPPCVGVEDYAVRSHPGRSNPAA